MSGARLVPLAPLLACALSSTGCGPAVAPPVAGAPPHALRAEGGIPDAPFRGQAPAPEPRPRWVPPRPTATTLANGMHLLVVERRSPAVVSAALIVRGGTAGYPQATTALAVASTIATQGTSHQDSPGLADTLNGLFADMTTGTSPEDSLRYRVRCMSKSFDGALQVLHDVVVEPTLSQPLLDVERQHRLAMGQRDRDDPGLVGQRMLFEAIFGADHPYALSHRPGTDRLSALTVDEVTRAWRRAIDPSEATLLVAGDVDAAALAGRVQTMFGGWKHDPAHAAPTTPPPPSPMAPRLFVIDRPGAAQATILYGAATPPATISAPWPIEAVTRELFGGMPSSRLARTLRDDLGVAPWSATRSWSRRGPGVMFWQGGVERDEAPEVLAALARRVAELRERGPEDGELADAKQRVGRVLDREFETAAGMIDSLTEIPVLGWSSDELVLRAGRVEALTAADVRTAVPPPESMKAVVIGDLGVLRDRLVALGWGEIEERTPEGERVRSFTR